MAEALEVMPKMWRPKKRDLKNKSLKKRNANLSLGWSTSAFSGEI